jgi:hypothetical protein
LRDVPTPAQRFDQQQAGIHAPAKNVHIVALVLQSLNVAVLVGPLWVASVTISHAAEHRN